MCNVQVFIRNNYNRCSNTSGLVNGLQLFSVEAFILSLVAGIIPIKQINIFTKNVPCEFKVEKLK